MNIRKGALKSAVFLGILFFWISFPAQGQVDTLEISTPAKGVTYVSLVDSTQPWRIHLLEIDLQESSLNLRTHKAAPDGNPNVPDLQTLPAMWETLDSDSVKPIAAINGDFFNMQTGEPVNMQVSNLEPVYVPEDVPGRSLFGVTVERTPFIDILDFSGSVRINGHETELDAINSLPSSNGLTLIATSLDSLPEPLDSLLIAPLQMISTNGSPGKEQYLLKEKANLDPPILIGSGNMTDSLQILQSAGDTVGINYQFHSESMDEPIAELTGGAVQLIKNGRQIIDQQLEIEGVGPAFASDRHPRTAVGFAPGERLWMVVVDGRQEISVGMSLYELSDFMAKLGATEALNLDGGGSTTMMVNGKIINSPSDSGGPRPITNTLFLIADPSHQ